MPRLSVFAGTQKRREALRPTSADRALNLKVTLWVTFGVLCLGIAAMLLQIGKQPLRYMAANTGFLVGAAATTVLCHYLIARDRLQAGSLIFVSMLTLACLGAIAVGGTHSALPVICVIPVATAGITLGTGYAVAVTLLNVVAFAAMGWLEIDGTLVVDYAAKELQILLNMFDVSFALCYVTLCIWLYGHSLQKSVRRAARAAASEQAQRERIQHAVAQYAAYLRDVSDGQLALRLELSNDWGDDLLVSLGHRLNHTVARLEELLDRERRLLEQLRELDRAKSRFFSFMTHELRSPLNGIIGFSRMLLKGLSGPLPEQARQDVETIHQSGQHLLALINDILDLSKIEAGKMELDLQSVQPADLVEQTLTVTRVLAQEGVELVADVDRDLPSLRADETRVKQVLFNLLSNACKFTCVGRIAVQATPVDGSVRFAVSDTGEGIPEDKQAEIFQEYSQSTAKHGSKGTGLGLPISRKLVELHGGKMWLESTVGKGTTFYFTVPVARSNCEV
jgi:signal transduction histidine kinase